MKKAIVYACKKGGLFMMSKYLTILFCIPLAFIFNCKNETSSFTKLDHGKTITVPLKKDFVIKLEANPSTGFNWNVLDIDTNIIQLKGTSYTPYHEMPGSNGMEQITFTSVKKGKSPLKLGYLRVWEGRGSMVDSFSITVKVR